MTSSPDCGTAHVLWSVIYRSVAPLPARIWLQTVAVRATRVAAVFAELRRIA
jgi:hypothetical protein